MEEKDKILSSLSDAVVDMEEDLVEDLCLKYIEKEFDPFEGINSGLANGMERAGKLYEEEEYYIPELLLCSDAMYRGIDILSPHIERDNTKDKIKAVVGVVEGDTHDIGKNLFKIMLETVGFEVIDLGRDVPPLEFVNRAEEEGADLIGMSTLMTTTMANMKAVMDILDRKNIRDKFTVMVGGGPVSQSFADTIGADGYAFEASKAAKLAKDIIEKRKNRV